MGTFCSSIGCAVISTSSAFMLCIQQHLIDIYVIDDIHYTRYYVDGHCTGLRRDCCHPPDWSHEGLAAAAWPPASSVCTGVVLPWRMLGPRHGHLSAGWHFQEILGHRGSTLYLFSRQKQNNICIYSTVLPPPPVHVRHPTWHGSVV